MVEKVIGIFLALSVTLAFSSVLKAGQDEPVYGPHLEEVYKRASTVDSSGSTSKYCSKSNTYAGKTIEIPTQLKSDRNRRTPDEQSTFSSGTDESEGTMPNEDSITTVPSNLDSSTSLNSDDFLDDVTSTVSPVKTKSTLLGMRNKRNIKETLDNLPKDSSKTDYLPNESSQKPQSRYSAAYEKRVDREESSDKSKNDKVSTDFSTTSNELTDLQELMKLAEEIDKLILQEEAATSKLRPARDSEDDESEEDDDTDSESEQEPVSRQKRLVSGVEVRSTREKRQLFGGIGHGIANLQRTFLNLEDSLLGIQGHDHNSEFGGGGYGGGRGGGHGHGGGYEGYGRGYGGYDGYDGLDNRGYPGGRY